ncbi:MAG: ATP-binding protein [Gemmataceae bacterium]|nr:ATP-binding protein [Gemmataceae bacterium]
MADSSSLREIILPSDTIEARKFQDAIEQELIEVDAPDKDAFCIRLALEEALVNAIKHGNQMDPAKSVKVQFLICPEVFEIVITDEGPGFDPEDVPDPTDIENLERPCGRGLMLMRHYMNEIVYNSLGNSVRMKKIFKRS